MSDRGPDHHAAPDQSCRVTHDHPPNVNQPPRPSSLQLFGGAVHGVSSVPCYLSATSDFLFPIPDSPSL